MNLKILAVGLLIGSFFVFATGCDMWDIILGTPPNDDNGDGNLLFFDDFEHGADEWISTTSHWRISSGEFVFYNFMTSHTGFSYVLAGKNWSNYNIEADIWIREGDDKAVGFVLYAQEDLSTKVIAWGNTAKIWWQVISDGETVYKSDPVKPGLFAYDTQHVQILASGNTYTFVVDGLNRSTFENTYYTTGMPGVAGINASPLKIPYPFGIDNFRVTASP